MMSSKLRVVSIGIAAENKALESLEIPVTPIELFPTIDGELVDTQTVMAVGGQDHRGVEYTLNVVSSNTLTCTWLPLGSNRVTPPDIRRGERLLIWQYADADTYYWTSMGLDDDQRRLETAIWGWSATPDNEATLSLAENVYSLEVSTHNKQITLHTTQADGEPFEYTIQLNTGDGIFFVTDQEGNSVQLNSAERIIKAINSDASEITIDKTKIFAYAQDEIRAHTDNFMEAKAGGDLEVTAGGNIVILGKGDVNLICDGNFNHHVKGDYNLLVDGSKNEVVAGMTMETHTAGQTVFSGGAIALDGVGVDLMSGLAGPASAAPPTAPTGGPKPSDNKPPEEDETEDVETEEEAKVEDAPLSASLPVEYSIASTNAVRQEAGRYAAMDEIGEAGATPADYPEDIKPAGFTGTPKTISDRTDTERAVPPPMCTTEIQGAIDYTMTLGTTSLTIGSLSTDALFAHQIVAQGGLSEQDIVCNLQGLAENILQPLVDEFGTFRINSGFRRGSGKSQHTRGQAVDIQDPSWSMAKYTEVAEWIADNLPCDQLILEHGNSIWLHVSFDASKELQRGQLLTMLNGKYEPGLTNYYA